MKCACKPAGMAYLLSAAILLAVSGCASFLSHLSFWSGASLVPPEYDDLAAQRVAVVCVSDTSSYGAGTEERLLARMVSNILAENIEEIELVSAAEVADWVDKNDWNTVDYREVGRGVKADRVVAIDLAGFRLHQDSVLYKGRADMSVSVFDMTKDGKEVYRKNLRGITYPSTGYYPTTDTEETTFRHVFLKVLARRATRYFFPYDKLLESTLDPADARDRGSFSTG